MLPKSTFKDKLAIASYQAVSAKRMMVRAKIEHANGRHNVALAVQHIALWKWQRIVDIYEDRYDDEPYRSNVIHEAASLAFRLGRLKDAARLAGLGLVGKPPPENQQAFETLIERIHAASAQLEAIDIEVHGKITDGPKP